MYKPQFFYIYLGKGRLAGCLLIFFAHFPRLCTFSRDRWNVFNPLWCLPRSFLVLVLCTFVVVQRLFRLPLATVAAARAWNSLLLDTRAFSSLLTFRRETKSHLFRQSYGWLSAALSTLTVSTRLRWVHHLFFCCCATVLNVDFVECPRNCVMAAT